jgi:hypothetical protein
MFTLVAFEVEDVLAAVVFWGLDVFVLVAFVEFEVFDVRFVLVALVVVFVETV